MKGRKLTRQEVMKLENGIKVWLDKMSGLDELYNKVSKVYEVRDDEFYNREDETEGGCGIYLDGWAVGDGLIEVYEWLEDGQVVTNKEETIRTYKGSEILAMIEDGTLKDEDIVLDRDGDVWKVEDMKSNDMDYSVAAHVFLNYAPFTVVENKREEV